jgi:hypothetical protein
MRYPFNPNRYHLALLAVVLIFAGALQTQPIKDVDTFTYIALGRQILQTGSLTPPETLVFSLHGQNSRPLGWLANVFFAALYRVGGWHLLQAVYSSLFALAFGIAGLRCLLRRPAPDLFSIIAAVVLGILVSLSNSSVRAQGIGFLCFSVLLYCLDARPSLRTSLLLAPGLCVWQNAHASLVVGALAAFAILTADLLKAAHARASIRPAVYPGAILALCLLCQYATPLGSAIAALTADNVRIARDVLGVSEWQPPWHSSVRLASAGYFTALALSTFCIVRLRFKIPLRDGLQVVLFTALSLYAARFAVAWALAMIPIWASWFERIKPGRCFAWNGEQAVSRGTIVRFIGLCMILCGVESLSSGREKFDPEIPIACVAKLRELLPRGRIYNYREWAGPLQLAKFPDWTTMIDGRLYLYDQSYWREYERAATGAITPEDIVKHYAPDAFFLRNSYQPGLIEALSRDPLWSKAYDDGLCSIFLPLKG